MLATWRESGTEYSAVSLDGERFVKVQPIDTKLRFRWQEFDPTVEVAVVPKSFRNAPTNWMIVQFRSQVLPEFHDAIRTLGGEILTYMPENALVCKLDENERQEVEALPYVRYVGKYESIFRIDPSLVASLEANTLPVQRYQIQVSDWNGVQKPQLAQRIQAIGGQTYGDYSGGAFLHATLTCEQLKAVCKMEEVIFVNEASAPENDMDIVRSVQGPNIVEAAPGNYKGQGIRGEVFDSGALATHVDFAHNGGITFRSNSSNNSHGTSTTGIVFGDGTGQAQGRGMLPACQGIFGTYGSIVVGGGSMSRYDWTAALVSTPLFGMFQSNSWGSSIFIAQRINRLN